jgi:predicted secreted protein
MTISSALAIYFVLWWVVLFAVLPFGVREKVGESGEEVAGADPGAPRMPRMAQKVLWTTIVSAILFAIGLYAHRQGYLNLDRLSDLLGFPR